MITKDYGTHHGDKTDNRDFTQMTRADKAGVKTHKQRNRHSHSNGKRTPRAVGQRFYHNQGQYRCDDDHNHQNTDRRNHTGSRAQFLFDDVAQGFTVAAHRHKQHHHILHGTGQHHTENNPQCAGQITHLRCQHRPYQWTCTRNCSKVVAEQYFFIGRHIIDTIVVAFRRCHTAMVELQNIFTDIKAVKTIGNTIYRYRSHHQPNSTDVFAATECQSGESKYPCQHHQAPYQKRFQRFHDMPFLNVNR